MGCAQVGPELEIPGYGCEDHFMELDTMEHSWECIMELIKGGHTSGIVRSFPISKSSRPALLCVCHYESHVGVQHEAGRGGSTTGKNIKNLIIFSLYDSTLENQPLDTKRDRAHLEDDYEVMMQ